MTFPLLMAGVLALAFSASGGDVGVLSRTRIRHEVMLLVLFVAQAVFRNRVFYGGTDGSKESALALWACLCVCMLVVLWQSRGSAGVPLMILGMAANALVSVVNHGMPVALSTVPAGFYHALGPADSLPLLADVLPAPGGLMLSFGDVVMMVGAAVVVLCGGHDTPADQVT
jgi:hypothetical protein